MEIDLKLQRLSEEQAVLKKQLAEMLTKIEEQSRIIGMQSARIETLEGKMKFVFGPRKWDM